MPTTITNHERMLERRPHVARLYVRGQKAPEIHKAVMALAEDQGLKVLKCDLSTIYRDIDALKKEWRKELVDDVVAAKARELASIEEAERQCWLQFQSSTGLAKVRWMTELREWKVRKARMLGLDKPVEVNVTGEIHSEHEERVTVTVDYRTWTDEQLREEWARMETQARMVEEANRIVTEGV